MSVNVTVAYPFVPSFANKLLQSSCEHMKYRAIRLSRRKFCLSIRYC